MWFISPILIGTILMVGAAFVGVVAVMAQRHAPADGKENTSGWLIPWIVKGLALPFLLWVTFNCGFFGAVQPLMPAVQAAQGSAKDWWWMFLMVSLAGVFSIGSYWAAGTVGWLLVRSARKLATEVRAEFRGYCLVWGGLMLLPALFVFWMGGWMTFGLALLVILLPIASYTPGLVNKPALPPMYARAIAKLKFGKYSEAEWEIIRQLEKHPTDFEGWLMLAKLYAEEYRDLPEAEQTVLEICSQPGATNSDVSVALHKLADWHLQVGDNPEGARRALWAICHRMPGTHLARMAELRLKNLPRSREELLEQRSPRPIALPPLSDSAHELANQPHDTMPRERAAQLANQLSAALRQTPNDAVAREKFARLLAEHLDQPGQGIEQLRLLNQLPDAAPEQRANWLSLIAAWQLHLRRDLVAARQALEQLVREFPGSPQAQAAQRRLKQMAEDAQPPRPPPLPKRIRVDLD